VTTYLSTPLERLKLIIFVIATTTILASWSYHPMRRSSIKSVITSWSRCLSGLIDLCTLGGRTPSSVTLVEDTFLPSTFKIAIAIVIPSSLAIAIVILVWKKTWFHFSTWLTWLFSVSDTLIPMGVGWVDDHFHVKYNWYEGIDAIDDWHMGALQFWVMICSSKTSHMFFSHQLQNYTMTSFWEKL